MLLLAIDAISSKRIRHQSCTSQTRGEIMSVDVTPCDQDPCSFRRGVQETLTIKFIPSEDFSSAKIYANGMKDMRGSERSISLPINHNACQGYGLTCPQQAGVLAELAFSVKPPFYIPRGDYALEVFIKDQNNNMVVCAKISLEIAWTRYLGMAHLARSTRTFLKSATAISYLNKTFSFVLVTEALFCATCIKIEL